MAQSRADAGATANPRPADAAQMLAIRDLRKQYGSATVLEDFNLDIARGEFVSLIGPSGCGKTTALRIVAGLLEASGGSVEVDGRPSADPSPDKAIVFQHFNLLPWRTALSNAAYGLELRHVPREQREEIAAGHLRRLGLAGKERLYPSQLSGGQRQRVGIARALAVEPKLLLMDEPFGALDALTREQSQRMLLEVCEGSGLTVLFVTHSLDEAVFLSDRVVVMGVGPGRIVEDIRVDIPRPRDAAAIRANPEHAELRNTIWDLLEAQLAAAAESA